MKFYVVIHRDGSIIEAVEVVTELPPEEEWSRDLYVEGPFDTDDLKEGGETDGT